jgi:very-short-patch-repair endonuclease
MTKGLYNRPEYLKTRRVLRSTAIKSEWLLWAKLRARRSQWKFRRQHGIGPYIVDFFCPKLKLAIEVDGISHERKDMAQRDAAKSEYLEQQGLRMLRFTSNEVCHELDRVVENIYQRCEELQTEHGSSRRSSTPSP